MAGNGGLHVQDVASKRGILIADGLLHVLLTMPDSIMLFVHPSLVAIGFGLSEQLIRSGSSTHLGHKKSGGMQVKGARARAARSKGQEYFVAGAKEKVMLERESSAGRAPYIESLQPWLDLTLRD
jgi:hypothetical protein